MHRIAYLVLPAALVACSEAPTPDPGVTASAGAPAVVSNAAPAAAIGVAAVSGANTPVTAPAAATPTTTPAPTASNAPSVAAPAMQPAASAMPAATPAQAPAVTPPSAANPAGGQPLAMDECGLHTQYTGDEYCILPPAPDKGYQLHIGPSNYDSPEPQYLLQPGEENVVNMTATSTNDKDALYYYRQYRMRPGSHHVILTGNGKSMGGTQNLARDNPVNGIIPPENADIGLTLAAHTQISANMHFYNFSDKPMLRELWVNYWYKDAATVKETAKSIFSMTGVTAAVAHAHVVVGASCPVSGTGHILTLAGHRHLSNVRFSIWHTSDGQKDLIFEDYDAQHPASLEYNSLATNPMPDATMKIAGGVSGIVNLKQGDTLDFECEIINMTDKNFFGANEAADDEMCILTGDTVGASVSGSCTPIASRKVTAQ